ncbi:MAG: carboxylesterase family protein, partial [Clostridia bacterium]|nr:carboxylesterase family protein [Clostridia bacterium]
LPVLVYIHGGSLQTGQPWYGDYSGEGLAKEGVIVVNMGYRLGVFGFFASEELAAESEHGTTGNYGLLDQIKALEWVQSNISAFGGDPDNVTVAGESAGAACVSALCTSPLAKGLFRRAILESSTVASKNPPHSYRRYDEAIESGKALMEKYGCSTLAELRALPAEKLVGEASTQHHITVDGYVLIEDPYESYRKGVHNEEALLHGYNSEESGPFILFGQANLKTFEGKVRAYFKDNADEVLAAYPVSTDAEAKKAWAEIWGAAFFDYSHYCLNRLAADNGIPVWQYRFSKHNGRLGPWHSGEEVYFYGNIPEDSKLFDERDRELGRQMLGYFVNFIKTGDPNGNGLPLWEENSSSVDLMEFGDSTRMIKEDKLPLYSALDKMDGWE